MTRFAAHLGKYKQVFFCVCVCISTFHGFSCLDELRDRAGHPLGEGCQLLLQIVSGLLNDLEKYTTVNEHGTLA